MAAQDPNATTPTWWQQPNSLPAPRSLRPGSFQPPPGYTYDPTTGQYVPTLGYTPGATPGGAPGQVNLPPGAGGSLTSNNGIVQPPAAAPPPAGPGGTTTTPLGPGSGLTLGPPSPAPGAPGFTAPPSYTPPPAFTAPSISDLMNSPNYAGFQFINQQGQAGLQNWAAAKGTLNDSETANALSQFSQNNALQYTQQEYTNALGTYNTNYATQYTDPYAIKYQGWAAGNANTQTNWQDLYNSWLASNQLKQGEQGLVIQGANAGL